jgi:hypothetical protein
LPKTVFISSFLLGSDNNNVRKLKDRNQNGTASTVFVGADDSNAKEEKMALRERISELKAPTVFFF